MLYKNLTLSFLLGLTFLFLGISNVNCSELITHYDFENGFINLVTGQDDANICNNSENVIVKNSQLQLINTRDHDPKRFIDIPINTLISKVIIIEKRSYIISKGKYCYSGTLFYNEKAKQHMGIIYNNYHYSGTNYYGQYTNREHFYILNVFNDGYKVSDLLDLRFSQWIKEKIILDLNKKSITYEIQNDDGTNIEIVTINDFTFDKSEETYLRLSAWDWSNSSQHIVDYIKIYAQKSPSISGCISLEDLPITSGKAMLMQSGEIFQSVPLDSKGCYNFYDINKSKPFSVLIRKAD